ncbi:MAG: hypothetical protein ACD_5C00075G0008 [uncultured bacterium]|nr:MAG: hypothetical protein ACD_5C00075G0008 [uncultured bacterium]
MKIYSLVFAVRSTSSVMLYVNIAENFVAAEQDARNQYKMQGLVAPLDLLLSNEFIIPEQKTEETVPIQPLIMIQKEEVKTLMSEKNQIMQTIIKFKDADLFRIKKDMFDENEIKYLEAKINF